MLVECSLLMEMIDVFVDMLNELDIVVVLDMMLLGVLVLDFVLE